jgi:hypothetical protein
MIFLFPAQGLLPFGPILTGLGTVEPVVDGSMWDAEFLSQAPYRPATLVVLVNEVLDVLLNVWHFEQCIFQSKNRVIWSKID